MKISLDWLSDYVDIKYSSEELASKITMAGLEVEEIQKINEIPAGIIVGEILERNPHPGADKLSVCKVSTGKETLQIVCGAPNCNAGVKAPLATEGTVFALPDGKKMEIKKCKLRGVESFGMLCSSRELGLDNGHDGIMELPADTVTGTAFDKIVKPDTVYTVEITPNRPDWLSHWGVARDIAALTGTELRFPLSVLPEAAEKATAGLVEVKDSQACPRYSARIIKGVKVKESPDWLKKRLSSIGLRPINNVVDITNFVLMELGHPLHAFDMAYLTEKRIVVRKANEGEKMVALDGKEYTLKASDLVIADAAKPVAIAGVMGGEHSGVTETTVDVLLESAYFDPATIRATSKRLGLTSDASYRYERGTDYDMVEKASSRAVSLILELAGGTLSSEFYDVKVPFIIKPVACDFARIRTLLAVDLDDNGMADIFRKLGMKVENMADGKCTIIPPAYRMDIEREADLAEEIARIHGLDKIPVLPLRAISGGHSSTDKYLALEKLKNILTGIGLYECLNPSLEDEKTALWDSRFTMDGIIKLSNPISLDLAVLRPSLFGGMLATVRRNISRKNNDLMFFECGTVFCADQKLYPEERQELSIAITGRRHPERFSAEKSELFDFYDLKGVLESFFERLRLADVSFKPLKDSRYKNGIAAEILIDGKRAGTAGEVAESLLKGSRIQAPLYMADLELDKVFAATEKSVLYVPLSQYPSVSRDVAFVADEALEHAQVIEFIKKAGLKYLETVELFDIFRGEAVGAGKKSMAYSLTFRNPEKTLTDDEVNAAHEKLRQKLAAGLGVELR